MPRVKSADAEPAIIRDKAFAKRLDQACENHPHVPTDEYRGKKKWIYDHLQEDFGITASAEAVRKWFTGEARPRPKTMAAIARLLEVDEAWLSLGLKPDVPQADKRHRNALAEGAVNMVAGFIQMSGGHIAFPEGADNGADITAIINGRSYEIEVKVAIDIDRDHKRFKPSGVGSNRIVIGVVPTEEVMRPQLILITPDVMKASAHSRGEHFEIDVERRGAHYRAGDAILQEILDFRQLDGPTKHLKNTVRA